MMRFLFLLVAPLAWAGPTPIQDLRGVWTIHEEGSYQPVATEDLGSASTIYFPLDTRKFGGHHLAVACPGQAYLFINGQLASSWRDSALFRVDLLRADFGDHLQVAVYAPGRLQELTTRMVLVSQESARSAPEMAIRPPTFFRDFGIIAGLILVLFFLILFRNNPQLTLDYFSFSKVFSSSERNETQLASRITSSENLLFYLFCALLMGFLLSAILYASGPSFMPIAFTSLGSTFLIWGQLSLFILLMLAGKLIIVLVFSSLFNFRETVSFQFFNFLRFVLFTAVTLSAISLVFFVFHVDSSRWYERLIGLALLLLTMGSVVVFLKLLGRLRFSLFHLFSYLCISEFIPLVILFKIFF